MVGEREGKKHPVASCHIHVRVEGKKFDVVGELAQMRSSLHPGAVGAIVSFLGLCRDEGGTLAALEIEHFAAMAQVEMKRIADSAATYWPLQALHIIHRHGRIKPNEEIVLLLIASAHRHAAFEAGAWVMDYLKTNAPFWKKQHWHDGRPPEWVSPAIQDLKPHQRDLFCCDQTRLK